MRGSSGSVIRGSSEPRGTGTITARSCSPGPLDIGTPLSARSDREPGEPAGTGAGRPGGHGPRTPRARGGGVAGSVDLAPGSGGGRGWPSGGTSVSDAAEGRPGGRHAGLEFRGGGGDAGAVDPQHATLALHRLARFAGRVPRSGARSARARPDAPPAGDQLRGGRGV